jgi:hypothetical protein
MARVKSHHQTRIIILPTGIKWKNTKPPARNVKGRKEYQKNLSPVNYINQPKMAGFSFL